MSAALSGALRGALRWKERHSSLGSVVPAALAGAAAALAGALRWNKRNASSLLGSVVPSTLAGALRWKKRNSSQAKGRRDSRSVCKGPKTRPAKLCDPPPWVPPSTAGARLAASSTAVAPRPAIAPAVP